MAGNLFVTYRGRGGALPAGGIERLLKGRLGLAALALVAGGALVYSLPAKSADSCDGPRVAVRLPSGTACIKPGSGESFKDCPDCPEMVVVPPGSFVMGSPASEPGRLPRESPQHNVTIAAPFAVGKFAVTFAEWDACVADGGCGSYRPDDGGWGRGGRPVINVNWHDSKRYAAWLSKKTGNAYRLLSEAEREYVARAGTTAPFWWGSSITLEQANYGGSSAKGIGNYYAYAKTGKKYKFPEKTLPVKSFDPNPWGLYQVHGNVREWVEDCWSGSYQGAPADGSPWTGGDCGYRILRGGSWHSGPGYLRAAARDYMVPGTSDDTGFRVARTLNP